MSLLEDLAASYRILAEHGVIDGYGHVSVRSERDPNRYFISRSLAPELVTEDDLMEFDLDNRPIDPRWPTMYSERPIHGSIYAARPDVTAVCHNHARSLIPFGITGTPIRPVLHIAGSIGAEIPVWDVRDEFGDTDLLVTTAPLGDSLARKLGPHRVCLMRGHGAVVAAHDLKATVFVSIYLMVNAALIGEARQLGEITYLSEGEIRLTEQMNFRARSQNRAWEYWARRAGFATTAND